MPDRAKPSRLTRLARRRQREAAVGSAARPKIESVFDVWQRLGAGLVGEAEYTSLEVAELSGIPIERLRQLWRALGFPPADENQRLFSANDVGVLKVIARTQRDDGTPDGTVVQLARVSGQSLARIAETEVELFFESGAGELSVQVSRLIALEPFLGYIWRRHLAAALGRKLVAREDLSSENVLTVGFADLVGFTRLARSLEPAALAKVVERFEHSVYQVVPEHNGRVIKMLGDEVMFATTDAEDGAAIAVGLVELHAADPILPPIRVGLSRGPVLPYEGDLFGATVNLASRLSDAARPATVLISNEMAEALTESTAFRLGRLHRMRLKGTGPIRACRLERGVRT